MNPLGLSKFIYRLSAGNHKERSRCGRVVPAPRLRDYHAPLRGSGSRGVLLDGDDQHAVDYRVLSWNHARRGVDKKELDLLDLLNIWVAKFGEGASEEWNALQKNVRALLGKGDFLSEEAERIRLLILDYIGVPSGFL